MYHKYTLLAWLATLGACAGAAPQSAPMAEPVPTPAPVAAAAPAPEPRIPLEQRWAAPFAVETLGALAPREDRVVIVLDSAAPAPAKPAARVARAAGPPARSTAGAGGGTATGTAAPAESAP